MRSNAGSSRWMRGSVIGSVLLVVVGAVGRVVLQGGEAGEAGGLVLPLARQCLHAVEGGEVRGCATYGLVVFVGGHVGPPVLGGEDEQGADSGQAGSHVLALLGREGAVLRQPEVGAEPPAAGAFAVAEVAAECLLGGDLAL